MVRALTIARVELIRLLRDRSNLFFVFVFPLLLVVLIGTAFGGGDQRIAVRLPAGDPDAADLVADLEAVESVTAVTVDDAAEVEEEVARGFVSAGLVIPDGYGQALRDGAATEVQFFARSDGGAMALQALVDEAVAERAAVVTAARIATSYTDLDAAASQQLATQVAGQLPGVEVDTRQVTTEDGLSEQFEGLGRFDLGASSQLFLFTFLTSMSGGAALIQTRQYGIAHRMLATPTSTGSILLGFAGGRFLVALLQALYIVGASALLFRVNWGTPLATGTVVLLFCLAAAGAGMLVGATFRNDSQAGGAGVGLGLGLAALGGSMVPLELFGEGMQTIASVTPHAWANRAMAEIVRRDGGLADVATEVLVLAAFAAGLLGLATWQLRRTLVR